VSGSDGSAAATSWVIGVDVGGTFTDVVAATPEGRLETCKVMTTPADPRDGVETGLRQIFERCAIAPSSVARVVHGTTLATNVILERRGASVAFVTTEGFRDLLRLGREARVEDDRFDLFFTVSEPPVPHRSTFEIHERLDAGGRALVAIDPAQVEAVAAQVAATAPEAVAICLLHSYANPAHEAMVADACRRAVGPSTYVVASSEVWPELREHERAMTTVLCAYVGPLMATYLAGLEERLGAMGVGCPVEIMESSGGTMSAALAALRPVYTVESGGAAGVMAAGYVGRLIGAPAVVSFDMGGTTAKAAIVRGGRPEIVHDFQVGGKGSFGSTRAGTGYPLKMPVVDLAEVGAGGGSLAWVDNGGALQVGPRSAGAVPGPACYGLGGTGPTVTDANVVLGYLRPGPLSGDVVVSAELAAQAVAEVAKPLGLSVTDAARLIHEVANANMASAIRVVTVQRGIDPRGFTLVGFGGAGPMHAVELADAFGITTVVIPRAAGVASAVGMVTSDLSVERVRTRIFDAASADDATIADLFAEIERQAIDELPGEGPVTVERSVDMRYRGQAHQLSVPVAPGDLPSNTAAVLAGAFKARYVDTYGIDLDGPAQFVTFRTRVTRPALSLTAEAPEPAADGTGDDAARTGERTVHFDGTPGGMAAAVYDWAHLSPGSGLEGPAIVESGDTTVAVPPGRRAVLDRWGNLVITRDAGS
jgi:N-methylhydantoinase A